MKKKIMYVLGFYPINGRSQKISKAIKEYYDAEIKFIYWNMNHLDIDLKDQKDYIFTSYGNDSKLSKLKKIYFFGKYIKEKVNEYNPDVIVAYHWEVFILVKIINVFKKKKIIYEISDIPAYSGILHIFLKKLEELFISKDDILIFASKYFLEQYPKIKNKFIIIDNKPEKFLVNSKEKFEFISKKKLVVSFIGVYRDFEIMKNIIDVVEKKEVDLLFFGDGAIRQQLNEYCKNKDNVYVFGSYSYEEIPKFYNISDVIISLYSNKDINTKLALGNKFYKVQAFKKIGLFPEGTRMGEYILKNKLGLVVNPYDKQNISEAIDKVLNKRKEVKEIIENLENLEEKEIFWEYEKEKIKGVL